MPHPDPQRSHENLVARLVESLAAATPVGKPQVVQTHISTVILAGDYAYKLKRPVQLPFLDFSTLERRRHFCEIELRLNQRTAPRLYLDVLPITGSIEAPEIDGKGEPIEWLLRMRRFDSQGVFDTLAKAGQLEPAHIDQLADHLADFHMGLEPLTTEQVPRKTAWHWARESLDEISSDPRLAETVAAGGVGGLRGDLEALFTRLAPERSRRIAAGCVREGHGDLHLANIVAWQGQVMVFDALEFEPALRRIDVINDAAFPFMDLHAYGYPALAWRFINAYVGHTGDYAGLGLLDAYAATRAVVRAKVALLAGGAREQFNRYWLLARRLVQPPGTPRLVLTVGLSGSGKSTVARELVEQMQAICVRSDVERKRLAGLKPLQKPAPETDLYSAQSTRQTYRRLADLAETLLSAGISTIVDAAFLRQDERETMLHLAERLNAPFIVVECQSPASTMRDRIVARAQIGSDPSDATPQVLDMQIQSVQPIPESWAPFRHVVVNDGTLDDLKASVRRLMESIH